jgi:hypothetical protein
MLTEYESVLVRWNYLTVKMQRIFEHFHEIEQSETDFGLKSLLREYTFVLLANFIDLRKDTLKFLHPKGLDSLDPSLAPFHKPITNHERTIRELRNTFYAHIDGKGVTDRYLEDILIDSGIPASWGDTLFFAGCAWGYASYIKINLRED